MWWDGSAHKGQPKPFHYIDQSYKGLQPVRYNTPVHTYKVCILSESYKHEQVGLYISSYSLASSPLPPGETLHVERALSTCAASWLSDPRDGFR
jgi:hypothetical protein